MKTGKRHLGKGCFFHGNNAVDFLKKPEKAGGKSGNSIDKNREKEYNDDVPVSVLTAGEEDGRSAPDTAGVFIIPEGEER